MELLRPDGRVISGLPCIYHLPGGIIFFTEAVGEDGESYIFDPAKTLQLVMQPSSIPGQMNVMQIKGFQGLPFLPTSLRVGRAACMVTDCTDAKILAIWRQAISGIVIAPAGMKIPPGERVH